MAIIPVNLAKIETSDNGRFTVNKTYHGRNLIRNSYNGDASGYDTKFTQCKCGTFHHYDTCPTCGADANSASNRAMYKVLTSINAIRDWFNTQVETVVSMLDGQTLVPSRPVTVLTAA